MPAADFWRLFPAPLDAGSPRQTTRPPRVLRTHLHAYACRIYVTVFRASIGLHRYAPAHPAVPPLSASCSSGQRFAYSFLQIPSRDGHPCRSANTSPCRVCRELSPPSKCALPGARRKGRSSSALFIARTVQVLRSMQPEIDVDDHLHGDRMALIHGRTEFVLLHGFDGFLVKPHAGVAHHAHVLGIALLVNDELQRNSALEVGFAGFLGELRLSLMDDDRGADAAAYRHDAAAVTAPTAHAGTGAVADADAAAHAGAEARVRTGSLRSKRNLRSVRHAHRRHIGIHLQ